MRKKLGKGYESIAEVWDGKVGVEGQMRWLQEVRANVGEGR